MKTKTRLTMLTDGVRIGVRRSVYALPALALILLAAGPASATLMTYDVSFSANTFQVGSGADPAPVDPVTGSFTITLDPAVHVVDDTADISLTSLNIALGSASRLPTIRPRRAPIPPGL